LTERATDAEAPSGRRGHKRQAILDAGTALFLRDGYAATSMDQIAADAAVSKQTVYKHFADKEGLFRAIVLGVTAKSESIVAQLAPALADPDIRSQADLRRALTHLARRYLDGVLAPHVLALRRLIIAEAERFPDLAAAYFTAAPARAIAVIAEAFAGYGERGLLQIDDAGVAAAQFAYLTLAQPLDRALFHPGERASAIGRERLVEEAMRIFFSAYGS
jgi:TetR/AcrR family transcriptional repressor of mexJK operon